MNKKIKISQCEKADFLCSNGKTIHPRKKTNKLSLLPSQKEIARSIGFFTDLPLTIFEQAPLVTLQESVLNKVKKY